MQGSEQSSRRQPSERQLARLFHRYRRTRRAHQIEYLTFSGYLESPELFDAMLDDELARWDITDVYVYDRLLTLN